MSNSTRTTGERSALDQHDPAAESRSKLAAAITDMFEARRLLARERLGYPAEDFVSSYFELRAGEGMGRPELPVAAASLPPMQATVRSRLKRMVFSLCRNNQTAMKTLTWTASRVRATAMVARLAAQYPNSTDRIGIKIQARDALVRGFPEALASLKAVRSIWRRARGAPRHSQSLSATPYNLEPFEARNTPTLYLHDILADPAIAADFQSALERMLGHAADYGRFRACVALNFYAGGGAENATLNYIKYYASRFDGSVLLLLTDFGPRTKLPVLPKNVFALDFNEFYGLVDFNKRQAVLFNCLLALRPDLLHIVNSVTGWDLLDRSPPGFFAYMKVVASNFALQFGDPERKTVVGYAATYLPRCIDKLDAVVTDNERFAEEGFERLGLIASQRKACVVRNPSKLATVVSRGEAERGLRARIESMAASLRLKVVWAGRLDEEKRIDILLETAKLSADFCDFHIFGDAVVSQKTGLHNSLRSQANIFFNGPFASPLEWERDGLKHVFFFTSRWEGMPNVLIEAAYLGMPICAMDVGGVRELIHEDTGWLLGERDGAARFSAALKALATDPEEAGRRTMHLIDLVRRRHEWPSFQQKMDQLMRQIEGSQVLNVTESAADQSRLAASEESHVAEAAFAAPPLDSAR
ncbi:glycosyltransferase [Bosea thiooxidans]